MPDTSSPESEFVVGVDLIEVDAVSRSIARFGDRYVRRLFTDAEISYCEQDPRFAAQRFAARFAAKEATMKALRVGGNDSIDWRFVEVRRAPEGWCDIVLHELASALATRRGVAGLALSMSHEPGYATATVVGRREVRSE